jgi:alpha-D-xyloside xylohydrolase
MRMKLPTGRVVTQITMAVATLFLAAWCAGADTPASLTKVSDGMLVKTAHDQVHIAVCGSSTIHATAAPGAPKASSPQQPWIVGPCAGGAFSLTQTEKFYLLSTDALQIKISIAAGGLQFADKAGNTLLTEGIWSWTSTRQYQPVEQAGGPLYNLSESFQMPEDEAIYGLGQHQTGSLNNRGLAISLAQNNTDVAVPLMISTRDTACCGTPPRAA